MPNAGKSTLLNSLVGTKVSIVSRKVQTTRRSCAASSSRGRPRSCWSTPPASSRRNGALDRAMVHSAWSGAADADAVCLLVDARKGVDAEVEAVLGRLREVKREKMLILNKIDLIPRERLLDLAAKLNAAAPFAETFMISALNGDGVEDLRRALAARMPPGPWLYPEDQVSDAPLRMLAAEITREKIYDRLHEELPYRSTVETDQWQIRPDGSVRIEQTIFVERESQRSIVLGKGGQTIKAIGQAARVEIAEAADAKVHLFLHVKVRENWADDPARYREMGLEFPRG
ncbi:GTPase Era [Methylobacterium oryzae CBMB20]